MSGHTNEPRPSEDAPTFPEARRRGFFDDLPTGSIEELRDWNGAPVQASGYETADAQHIVAALDRQTEQLRIRNLLQYADSWPFARPELRDVIEKELGL